MANIAENLAKILSSRYGKDVRQAIHDSISDINDIAEGQEQTIEGHIADAEAWAKGTKDGTPVESTDPQYHNNAKYFSDEAASSATSASNSANAAAGSATTADNKSKDSEAWAVGQRSGADVPSTDPTYENNAKYWQAMANYWYLQAKAIAEGLAGALIPMGTVTFVNLPSLASVQDGWMYNISDSFTTTSDFKEGSGHVIPEGSNVYKTGDGKWDVLAGSPVSGVKGSAEANYRTGNVDITPTNIGLGNVDNESITPLKSNISWYGTCSTAAATTAKISTSADSKFSLVTGAKVRIKFTYTNTASAPTLNVDSKGAKSIKAYDTTAPTIWWNAGDVVDFTYDGTNWIMGATQGEIEQIKSALDDKAKATDLSNFVIIRATSKTVTLTANTNTNITFDVPIVEGYKSLGLYSVGTFESSTLIVKWILSTTNLCQVIDSNSQTISLSGYFIMIRDI